LEELQPSLLDGLLHARLQLARQASVEEFESHLTLDDWTERQWERFFRTNKWIFGHGLDYQFLSEVEGQPFYGGKDVGGTGGQHGDYLMATGGDVRFTVLVEIKTPSAELLAQHRYRNRVWELGKDLTGGASQMQSSCRTWSIEGSREEHTSGMLRAGGIVNYEPKGILVVGRLGDLVGDLDKIGTFELFRRNLVNPTILTFDELLRRARYIVDGEADSSETTSEGRL
jgi:hypothetical protein